MLTIQSFHQQLPIGALLRVIARASVADQLQLDSVLDEKGDACKSLTDRIKSDATGDGQMAFDSVQYWIIQAIGEH